MNEDEVEAVTDAYMNALFEFDPAFTPLDRYRNASRAAISKLDEMRGDGWQPIETAPKDGTRFDVWINSRRVADAYYTWLHRGHISTPRYLALVCDYVDKGGSQLCEDLSDATHWMPLPPPPEESQ